MNETIVRLLAYVAARLKEPSTYVALGVIATGVGSHFSAEQKQAILEIGLIVSGLIGALLPDRLGSQNGRVGDHVESSTPPQEKQP